MKHRGRTGGGLGRPIRGVLAGAAATVLVYGLAYLVKLPYTAALAVVIGAMIVLLEAVGVWSASAGWAVRSISDFFRRARRGSDRRDASRRCADAAARLEVLFAAYVEALRKKPKWRSEHGLTKQLLADYGADHRPWVQYAIQAAEGVLIVPADVMEVADSPHTYADLQYLCRWLRSVGDEAPTLRPSWSGSASSRPQRARRSRVSFLYASAMSGTRSRGARRITQKATRMCGRSMTTSGLPRSAARTIARAT